MPENEDFSVQIEIGGIRLPEYTKDGKTFVESNLMTPYSYRRREAQFVAGDVEAQDWPVTPYTVQVSSKPDCPRCYYRVLVDGVKVKGLSLENGQKRVIRGFKDGANIREFLFSMPRFAQSSEDRIDNDRESKIGTIEVQCWNGTLQRKRTKLRNEGLQFDQANKKDAFKVTQGAHTMATSKAGNVVTRRSIFHAVDHYKLGDLRSKLIIHYRMGHTLTEMGFQLTPFPGTAVPSLPQSTVSRRKRKRVPRQQTSSAVTSKKHEYTSIVKRERKDNASHRSPRSDGQPEDVIEGNRKSGGTTVTENQTWNTRNNETLGTVTDIKVESVQPTTSSEYVCIELLDDDDNDDDIVVLDVKHGTEIQQVKQEIVSEDTDAVSKTVQSMQHTSNMSKDTQNVETSEQVELSLNRSPEPTTTNSNLQGNRADIPANEVTANQTLDETTKTSSEDT